MKISLHHIGGRWGSVPCIAKWRPFFPTFAITLYEPDAGAAAHLHRLNIREREGYASVDIQTHCLGEHDGVSDFYLCFDRSASSMLPFDPAAKNYAVFIPHNGRGTYILETANKSTRISVNVRSLSSLIAEAAISAPDVISVDAEGACLQILRGMGEKNVEKVVGLFVESSFIPHHIGESPLHEMLKFTHESDFLCVDLGDVGRFSMSEMHIGAFDRGPHSAIGDALFLKNPAKVDAPEALRKLALIAILAGAVSIAYECFKKLEALKEPITSEPTSLKIGDNCLSDFYQTYCAYRDLTLPKLDETFTEETHNYMQYASAMPEEVQQRYFDHLRSTMPKYLMILSKYKNLEGVAPPHDALYEKYGLPELAAAARTERLKQIEFLKDVLARSGLIKRG